MNFIRPIEQLRKNRNTKKEKEIDGFFVDIVPAEHTGITGSTGPTGPTGYIIYTTNGGRDGAICISLGLNGSNGVWSCATGFSLFQ